METDAVFYLYERISAVRQSGDHAEIIHRATTAPRRKLSGKALFPRKDSFKTGDSFERVRAALLRDCFLLTPRQYIEDRFIPSSRAIFLEFQSMDSVHEGEMVIVNAADIVSYGGTTNDGGVHVLLSSGLMTLIPVSLQAFAHAHERHRQDGRVLPAAPAKKEVA